MDQKPATGKTMSKSFGSMGWLTVSESAKRLSISLGEDFTERDIYHLIADKRIVPSLFITGPIKASRITIYTGEEATKRRLYRINNSELYYDPEIILTLNKGLYDIYYYDNNLINHYLSFLLKKKHNKLEDVIILIIDDNYTYHINPIFYDIYREHYINQLDPYTELVIRVSKLDDFCAAEDKSKEIFHASLEPLETAPTDRCLEARLIKIVSDSFWCPPPEGHNRPTKKQITEWLMRGFEEKGLTNKGAERVYQASKPDNIPKHGNLPRTKLPFPDPPHPN